MSGQIDNGLSADDWMLLADVEAPFTDHILSALAEKGIAAYAEPFTSPESSYLGTPRASGPSDRVMVDRKFRSQAREVLAVLLPELRAEFAATQRTSDEQSWNTIVSGLTNEGVGQSLEVLDERDDNISSEDADAWGDVRVPEEFSEDPTDHFIPPEPPPIPSGDPVTRFAWAALAIGPLYLLLGTVLGWDVGGFNALVAVSLFIGGGVTLIARMDNGPSIDDRGDDGAVL